MRELGDVVMRRRRWGVGAREVWLVGALLTTGCGPSAAKPGEEPRPPSAENPVKARELLYRGEERGRKGAFAEARALFNEAEPFADTTVREEIRVARELVDDAEAEVFAPDIVQLAGSGKCAEALEETVLVVERGEGIANAIRKQTEKAHRACVTALLEGGQVRAARELLAGPAAQKALDAGEHRQLSEAVSAATARAVDEAVGAALAERSWADALARAAALAAAGDARPADVERVTATVRERVLEEVAAWHQEGMDDPKLAGERLAAIDARLAVAWPPDGATVPEAVKAQRAQLAVAVGCAAVACKPVAVAEQWAYGDLPLNETKAPGEPTTREIEHGARVWLLAEGRGKVLIAAKDPGAVAEGLGARVGAAAGWVDARGLRGEDTSGMMPPGKALVGTRVWGPLRQGQSLFELGTVTRVDGAQAVVLRMADRGEATVPAARLHLGKVDKGMKVLAFCSNLTRLEPAMVLSVEEPKYVQLGDPTVSLECLDAVGNATGNKVQGQLASVRIEPGWLPPRQ